MPPDPPPPPAQEQVLDGLKDFPHSPEEREAYLDYLRSTGASEDYIKAAEKFWEEREELMDTLNPFDDLWQWLGELLGIKDERSG